MNSDTLTLRELFSKDVRYVVPSFQRPYVWNQTDQWDPLWDDVKNTAESYLEALDKGGGQPGAAQAATGVHFLGAVVARQEPTPVTHPETRTLIDGQQRLTTLQLLLDAAQEVFEDRELGQHALLRTLVLNNDVYTTGDADHAFKVWPTTGDQEAFRYAMRNELPSGEYEESRIVEAHEFFKDQIAVWLAEASAPQGRAEALYVALAGQLQVVVINLGQEDDPHVIFETLNARGTPLLDSDLVKNYLMYEARQHGSDPDELHKSHLRIFEEPWWRAEVRQGRIYRPRVDLFLYYWLVMRGHKEVPANGVFRAFREHAEGGSSGSVEEIAADLRRIAETYRTLEEADDDSVLGRFLYRWRVMQAGVATPVLMWLLSHTESELRQPELERSIRAVESYLVRRMVCRMTAKDYNSVFLDLLVGLDEAGPARAAEIVVRHLVDQEADSRLWPDDRRLEDAFLKLPVYRLLTRGRLRLVLEGIEEQLRTEMSETTRAPRSLTIEHIMPQEWRRHWKLDGEAPDDDDEAASQRDQIVHTIGNLTLINGKLNSAVSNGPWDKKRTALAEHSVLHLNKSQNLLDSEVGKWDELRIQERARQLAKVAAAVWPMANTG